MGYGGKNNEKQEKFYIDYIIFIYGSCNGDAPTTYISSLSFVPLFRRGRGGGHQSIPILF